MVRGWGVEVHHIQPGKPAQNAYIERFNRTFREDVLDAYIFDDLEQLQLMAEQWAYDYNHNHPHTALGEYHRSNTHQSPNLALSKREATKGGRLPLRKREKGWKSRQGIR